MSFIFSIVMTSIYLPTIVREDKVLCIFTCDVLLVEHEQISRVFPFNSSGDAWKAVFS